MDDLRTRIARRIQEVAYRDDGYIFNDDAEKLAAEIMDMCAAQADRNPKGEKPQALSAKHESPVGEADAPKTCPGE